MNVLKVYACICLVLVSLSVGLSQRTLYRSDQGFVNFQSDAPLELIEASSDKLRGAIRPNGQFAFAVRIQTFRGFNSPLQREHFQENYMESDQYKLASFSGKLIEEVSFTEEGTYEVRAKGTLDIHGVRRERIIRSKLTIEKNVIRISSDFTILLKEHDITIPKIVNQKIAEEISVHIEMELKKVKR